MDLVGSTFKNLTVISGRKEGKATHWTCKCSCGDVSEYLHSLLYKGMIHCNHSLQVSRQVSINQTYGRLTVIAEILGSNPRKYSAKCSCGVVKEYLRSNLLSGGVTSCGCKKREKLHSIPIGSSYSRWTVIEEVVYDSKTCYKCVCRCGNVSNVSSSALIHGKSKSCGCLNSELAALRATKHNLSGTLAYGSWLNMHKRTKATSRSSNNYYSRGIIVCKEWANFNNFYKDMGERPPNTTLDRINNDGNYCKENCRWATNLEQARNKSREGSRQRGGRQLSPSKWAAQIKVEGSYYWLGTFYSHAQAVQARLAAEAEFWSVQGA